MSRRWQVLALVSVAMFMASLDLFIVNIAFPEIEGDFAGTSVSAHVVGAQRLRDRLRRAARPGRPAGRPHGRKRVFLGGSRSSCSAPRCAGSRPSVGALVGARVIQAAGAALLLPTSLALLLPEFAPHERPPAIGIWAAVGAVAAAAGPAARRPARAGRAGGSSSSSTSRSASPRSPSACASCARPATRDAGRPDLLGTALLAAAVGALALGLVKAPDWGWSDPAHARRRSPPPPPASRAFWARCLAPVAGRRPRAAARALVRAGHSRRSSSPRRSARCCSPTCSS